jgi:hypothetical protein
MQNKANFKKVKLNVTKVLTKDYDQLDTWSSGKNKPNSNPIQTQFKANQSQNKPNTKPNKANFKGKKMLPKAWPGVIVESAGCLKYYITSKCWKGNNCG